MSRTRDAGAAHYRGGDALAVLEERSKQIRRFERLSPGARRVVISELEDQLRRGGHAKLLDVGSRLSRELDFHRMQHGVRIQVEIAHHAREQIPIRLGERDEQMLIADDRVLAASSLLRGTVRQPLSGLTHLASSDVEVFHGSPCLLPLVKQDRVHVRVALPQRAEKHQKPLS
jgi:hypothetical protein